ncbi:MAG: LLM class flavin-dependent oxidoreductase [Pseudomonadota bacterium]
MADNTQNLRIFSTCPQSKDVPAGSYLARVGEVARWSEAAGYEGILVYTDNGIVDPWPVAQAIVTNTKRLCPLIAVQPLYMHPYTAAKMVSTFSYLYNRRLWINMVAGGFKNDLTALNDETPHDDRYLRVTEYATIMQRLLTTGEPVTFEGKYYSVTNLKMTPPLPPENALNITLSGSSPAGMAAAEEIGAVAIRYPKEPGEEAGVPAEAQTEVGVRIGIIGRDTADAAWRVALDRFPEDKRGQITHQLAMKTSDSEWHKQLSAKPATGADGAARGVYWLGPFQNYKTFCPYLVGSYEEVSDLVADYIRFGFKTFILDIPPAQDDIEHTAKVFEMAKAKARELEVAS